MGKPKKQHRKNKFNYDKDRRKSWKKSKKLPAIECKQIKNAWDEKKSLKQNMMDMGIAVDPNKTIKIPTTKEMLKGKKNKTDTNKSKAVKSHVVEELEAEASVPQEKRMKLSEPEVRYCVYMMEKYGEDYKAMARDRKNYYQDTPKQIKHKINVFKSIPEQYNTYLQSREFAEEKVCLASLCCLNKNDSTPLRQVIKTGLSPHRRATRTYRAKRRNGHYTTPTVIAPTRRERIRSNVIPLHKVKRKLHFGRMPPKSRVTTATGTPSTPTKERKSSAQRTSSSTKPEPNCKRQPMSRELQKLLDVTNCLLPMRLRSSFKFRGDCHSGETSHCAGYQLHSSPEHTNLKLGRGS